VLLNLTLENVDAETGRYKKRNSEEKLMDKMTLHKEKTSMKQ
jgi:hypothetical protein